MNQFNLNKMQMEELRQELMAFVRGVAHGELDDRKTELFLEVVKLLLDIPQVENLFLILRKTHKEKPPANLKIYENRRLAGIVALVNVLAVGVSYANKNVRVSPFRTFDFFAKKMQQSQ